VTRALFVAPNLARGGAERQWSILLPRLAARGHAVILLTLDGEGSFAEDLREQGIVGFSARFRHRRDVAGLVRALRARRYDPDVVVSQGTSANVVGALLKRLTRGAHAVANHTLSPDLLRQNQHRLERLVARNADAAVAVSQAQVPALAEAGFRRDRIRVIPNGVELAIDHASRASMRAELGLGDDDFGAFLVATLRPEKRALHFADAVLAAHKRDPRVRGVIVGSGPDLAQLEERSRSSAGALVVTGERDDIGRLLPAADAVCLTSLTEALPMTLLEGMAAGKPVISTAVGGAKEVVVDGETGILVARDDIAAFAAALVQLAGDRQLAAELGRRGLARQRAHYTAESMVDGYDAALRELEAER
jgi:glycosyltransferase involved in cell wall biosynthesis